MSLMSQPLVFETLRTYRGNIRAFEQHMKRLFNSWCLINHYQTSSMNQFRDQFTAIEKQILKLCESKLHSFKQSNSLVDQVWEEYVIRVYLSHTLEVEIQFNLLDLNYINHPISLKHSNLKTIYPPAAKHTDREAWLRACRQLQCDEIILCSPQGFALESNNSNLWALELNCTVSELQEQLTSNLVQPLRQTKWYTPSANGQILPGITRALLLKILQDLGAEVDDQAVLSMRSHSNPLKRTENHTQDLQVSLFRPQTYAYFLSSTLKSLSWVQTLDDVEQARPSFLSELYSLIENELSRC